MRVIATFVSAIVIVCLFTATLRSASVPPKRDSDAVKTKNYRHHHYGEKATKKPETEKPTIVHAESAKPQPEKAKVAADVKSDSKAVPAAGVAKIVQFTLKGEYPEHVGSPSLFGEQQPSLRSLVQQMDDAVADPDVKAVWLKIENPSLGRGKFYELRMAITRLRKANKPVFAELTSATDQEFLLAGACDKIVMPPSGTLMIVGVRVEVTFYKALLDKVGLQFDTLQMGKYKGAAEPMTRNEMSRPLRRNYEDLMDRIFDDLADEIATARHLRDYQVKTLMDQGLFTASAAKKSGLIDDVLYSDQLQAEIQKAIKADTVKVVTDYHKKKVDTGFSGIGGMLKLAGILMGGKPMETKSKKQKIAVIYAVGSIVEGKSQNDTFSDPVMGSATIISALKKAAADPQVVGIVLRVDSPGGSAAASDLIWRETSRMSKPVIASMGDVAASGGYYIALGAKVIFATPETLTGSIGVIGGKLVTHGMYEKLGIHTEVISRGVKSGMFSSNQPFNAGRAKGMDQTT